MLETKYKRFNRCPKACSQSKRLQYNKGPSNMSPTSTHDQLSYNIPIVTTITKGSYICSHQGIDNHCRKENHTRQTQARRV